MTVYEKHMAAIERGAVSKSNVIGLRKAINAAERKAQWLSTSITAPNISLSETLALRRRIGEREPQVIGALHDTGFKVLRSRRYRRRWNEAQAAVIERLDHFKLARFDIIGPSGLHSVPVYRAVATTGQSFLFRNIPWQSASYMGEESGPVIVEEI